MLDQNDEIILVKVDNTSDGTLSSGKELNLVSESKYYDIVKSSYIEKPGFIDGYTDGFLDDITGLLTLLSSAKALTEYGEYLVGAEVANILLNGSSPFLQSVSSSFGEK